MSSLHPLYEKAITSLLGLLDQAKQHGDKEANAAALATSTLSGRPSVRTINVVQISTEGLVLFANTETGKGHQLQMNPRAALCFHWASIQHQAIIEGDVSVLPESDSAALWRKQPREYGLGHWASDQASSTGAGADLKKNLQDLKKRFTDERVPLPEHWRAFRIVPDRIDLWSTGWQRLLPRVSYRKSSDQTWECVKENP